MLAVSVSSDTCTGRVADNSSVLTAENLLTVDEIYRLIQRATLVVGGPRAYLQWRAVSKRAKWLNEHVAVLCDSTRDGVYTMSLFDYMQSYPLAGANGARWAVRTGCRDAIVYQLHAVVGNERPQFMELAYEAVLQRKECILRIVYDVMLCWDVIARGGIVTAVVNLAIATGWLLPIILLAEYGLTADTNILHSLDNHKILPSALGLLSGDADEILRVLEPAMVANTLLRADVFVGACNALMDTLMDAFETALAIAREWSITVETFIAADARDSIIEYALYVENQRILDSIAPEICYVASAHVDDITAAVHALGDAIPLLLVVIVRAQLTRSFAWLIRTRGWRMSENVLYYVIAHGTAEMAQIALAGAATPCTRLLEAAILSERADVLSVVCAHGCEITFSTGAYCIAYISADWWLVVANALDSMQISCYHVAHALLGAPGKYFTPPAKHTMEAVLVGAARCAKYHNENVIVHMAECGLLEDLMRVDAIMPVRTPRAYNRIMDSDSIAAAVKAWFEPYGDTTEYAEYTARMVAKSARVQTERAKTNALLRHAHELARDYESRHTCYLRVVAGESIRDSYHRYEWDTYAGWRATGMGTKKHKPPAHIAIVDALPRDRAELDEFADQLALAATARAQNQITAKRKRNRRTNARRLTASERRERERTGGVCAAADDGIHIIDCSADIASKYVATQSKTVAQPRAIIFVNVSVNEIRAFAKRRRLV